jgi:hypothetical protein
VPVPITVSQSSARCAYRSRRTANCCFPQSKLPGCWRCSALA